MLSGVEGTINQNVLTPNNYASNDVFIIQEIFKCDVCYPNNQLQMFNIWGTMVYEISPYENNWSGRSNTSQFNNKLLPNGTYYYVFKPDKNLDISRTGYVVIRR